jgi:nickel/cobalt exporter
MVEGEAFGLLAGAVALGAVHGIEPGHGWPVAASYALDQTNKWVYGFAASVILGVGHLLSSIAMVVVFFYAKGYFNLTQVNEPIEVLGGVRIGGPVSLVAGVLLIALGVREYFHGHSHRSHGNEHGQSSGHQYHDADQHSVHEHADSNGHSLVEDPGDSHANFLAEGRVESPGHGHSHDHAQGGDHGQSHSHGDEGRLSRLKGFLPFMGADSHSHGDLDDATDRGLFGIVWFAFVLGFAHEEEFEIIALCAGSNYCLELMSAYAATVVIGIVGLTMLLIAGYQHYEEKVEQFTPYLPVFSAAVLSIMGLGFIFGLF